MLRYIGAILTVVLASAMALAIAGTLAGELSERLGDRRAYRLTVIDAVGSPGGPQPRLRGFFLDATLDRPVVYGRLMAKFDDGRAVPGFSGQDGHIAIRGPEDLLRGEHRFSLGFAETHPRLDVTGWATAWIRPADEPVLWIDAWAIVPRGPTGGPAYMPAEITRDVLSVVKTLTGAWQPVYLVAAEARQYAAVRSRLERDGFPRGPVFWVDAGKETGRLTALRDVWPRVGGAVVCTPQMGEAARRLRIPVYEVPGAADPDAVARLHDAWRNVLEGMLRRSSVEGK